LAPNLAVDGLIYNSDIFAKAGITEMPKTQDEMYEMAKSLTKRPDQFGYAVRHTVAEKVGFIRDMIPWILGYDGAYAVGKTPTVNSEPMINVLTMWRNMYEAAFPQGAAAADYRRMMATGLLAMNTDNNAVVPTFYGLDEKSKEFVTSAPLPWTNHKGAAFSSYNGLVPSGDATKEQASAAFMEFWFTPENFKTWNWEILAPPMVPEANTKEYLDSLPWMAGFSTTVPVHNSVVYGEFFPFLDEFRTILIKHASEVVVGTISPEAGAAAAQTELEEMAKRVFA
jgi:ABC-type glycerol-3-phosphate transport system substrate-binding protein